MREAINSNPMVQLALLGVLVLVAGVMLVPQLLGKKGGGSTEASSVSAPAVSPTGSVDLSGGSSTGTASPPTTSGSVSPDALVPGPGLPRPVITAWKRGDAVVLLVVRQGGIDDRLVRGSVQSLSSEPGTSVFITKASEIARYSRITQGVGVSQAPALVIVRPRRVSGSVPEAQVSYGFRDAQGVVQAVHDAVYSGKDNLPYSPG